MFVFNSMESSDSISEAIISKKIILMFYTQSNKLYEGELKYLTVCTQYCLP